MPLTPQEREDVTNPVADPDFVRGIEGVVWKDLVNGFAFQMKAQIERNMHKGGREAWLEASFDQYLLELQQNVAELRVALTYGNAVLDKAADVAVDAFIIWDIWHTFGGIQDPAQKGTITITTPKGSITGD